jgi:phosphatidate cytidylyltransferase
MGKINRNNLATRTISGAGFVLIILGSIFLNYLIFAALFLFVTIFTLYEFQNIHHQGKCKLRHYLPSLIAGAIIYLSSSLIWFENLPTNLLFVNLILLPLLLISSLYNNEKTTLQDLAFTVFGLFWIVIPFSSFNLLFTPEGNSFRNDLAIGFFIIIWAYDSFAYLTGITFGKRRLFERISPKKSWEGAFGGFLFGLIAAFLMSFCFDLFSTYQWLMIAAIIMVFGTFGDLAESLIKRSRHIKDSGRFLPGHGGLLDRFDAALLAAPAVVVYVYLVIY